MTYSVYDRLLKRELGDRSPRTNVRGLYGDRTWVSQLDIVNELGGHNGCVNALSWSKSGALLASGSDDQYVNIHAYQPEASTSPFRFTTTIDTGHSQNIFSVKFMPHSNDRTIVTAAGDAEVRIFDIEYASRSGGASRNINARRTQRGMHSGGVQYLSEGDTNARVYRSHTDRVKRIVTESSPHLFLSCSEDGEVRQWDLRQPSSAYPRQPQYGRSWMFAGTDEEVGIAPPPLISYKKWRLDLNTISCSPSQPHYIALGGAHLHCFLHDRRMLGRDTAAERGWSGSSSSAKDLSEHDDELMGEATRCVKRFAPNGRPVMQRDDNGHITACKISDSNPNELIVSWSQDYIYNFDMVQAPDARHMPSSTGKTGAKQHDGVHSSSERKRKRAKDSSALSQEGSARASSKARRQSRTAGNDVDMALRVRYENGQSEQIPIQSQDGEGSGGARHSSRKLSWESREAFGFAKTFVKIKKAFSNLAPAKEVTSPNSIGLDTDMTRILGLAASVLPEMDKSNIHWRYPLNPEETDVVYQRTLRKHREAAWRFVQTSGVLARLFGGRLQTAEDNESRVRNPFVRVTPAVNESSIEGSSGQFCYDFIKAIVLWLDSGPTALVEGFTSRRPHPRFPVPKGSGIESIEEFLIPYLLRMAGNRPIPNLEASRFEVDSNRQLFSSEKAAVLAFASALKIPFQDLTGTASSSDPGSDTQDRKTALRYWGFRVARGVLKNAGDELATEVVFRAFGGHGSVDRALKAEEREAAQRQEDINPEQEEPAVDAVGIVRQRRRVNASSTSAEPGTEGTQQQQQDPDEVDMVSTEDIGAALAEAGVLEEGDIEEIIDPDGSHRRGQSSDEEEGEYSDDDGDVDEDDDDDEADAAIMEGDSDDDDDEDEDEDDEEQPMMFRLGLKKTSRKHRVHADVPCTPHIRQFRGHCNVKTVKDVNFFGRNDEYVVSGSDCGHVFIWDKATSQLVNILKGDGEVVNVIQSHPYEPTMAVSGIDHTVKIFSPDLVARRDARKGINLCNRDASESTSSLRASRLGIRRSRLAAAEDRKHEEQDAPPLADSDLTNTEDEDEGRASESAVSRNREYVSPDGLVSRRRMHHEYRITSQNDADRQAGNRSTFLTASMLAQLFAGAQMHQGDDNDADGPPGGAGGRRDDNDDDDDDDEAGAAGGGGRRGARGIQIGFVNGRLTLRMA